jgi:ATP sulfurylase
VWQPDKAREAHKVFGTASLEHPGVYDLAVCRGRFFFGGAVLLGGALWLLARWFVAEEHEVAAR